eukprot:CAMPEP_0179003870 /NCGR_PEP_ID=MMETSP0795-20121207/12946_1 /TAXON_ID=88552 /ORGANISM="Amoebophrya sp., Strain Ameob2" /LENGTH=720 /DNA_ID=CAMNT_0020697983 /DNA_START=381 /DNA_END=2540 /DNA_ORIENTATION=+
MNNIILPSPTTEPSGSALNPATTTTPGGGAASSSSTVNPRPKSGVQRRPRAVISPYDIIEDNDEEEHELDNFFLNNPDYTHEPISPRPVGSPRPGTSCSQSAQTKFEAAGRIARRVERAIAEKQLKGLHSSATIASVGGGGDPADRATFLQEVAKVSGDLTYVQAGVEQVLERHKAFAAGAGRRAQTATVSRRGSSGNFGAAASGADLPGRGQAAGGGAGGQASSDDDERGSSSSKSGGLGLVARDLCPPEWVKMNAQRNAAKFGKDMITVNKNAISEFAPQAFSARRRLQSAERNKQMLRNRENAKEKLAERTKHTQNEYQIKLQKAELAEWRKQHMKPTEMYALVRPGPPSSSQGSRPATGGRPGTAPGGTAAPTGRGDAEEFVEQRTLFQRMFDIVIPERDPAVYLLGPPKKHDPQDEGEEPPEGPLWADFWLHLAAIFSVLNVVDDFRKPPAFTPRTHMKMKRMCSFSLARFRLKKMLRDRREKAAILHHALTGWTELRTQWFCLSYYNRAITIQRWWRTVKTFLRTQYQRVRERFNEVEKRVMLKKIKEMEEVQAKEKAKFEQANLSGGKKARSKLGGRKKEISKEELEEKVRFMMVPEEIRARVIKDHLRYSRFTKVQDISAHQERWFRDHADWLLGRTAVSFLGIKLGKTSKKAPPMPLQTPLMPQPEALLELVKQAHALKDGWPVDYYVPLEDRVKAWMQKEEEKLLEVGGG